MIFLFTNDVTGTFRYDDERCGRTFSLKGMTITGNLTLPSGNIERVTNADIWVLEQLCNRIYIQEIKRLKPGNTYAYLKILQDLSGNGACLDIKVSFNAGKEEKYIEQHKYTVVKAGVTNDGKPIITTLRAAGNLGFGSNMRFAETQFPLIPTSVFYGIVMRKVGQYNQDQNNGNGYNDEHPYHGEHTYSGSYIYYGFYRNFYE